VSLYNWKRSLPALSGVVLDHDCISLPLSRQGKGKRTGVFGAFMLASYNQEKDR